MNAKVLLSAAAVICVIAIAGFYMGWFGGGAPQTETPAQQEAPATQEEPAKSE